MGTRKQLLILMAMLSLLSNPCMAGEKSVPLSNRSIAPKEYDQAGLQRYQDDTQRQLDDIKRRLTILESGG